MTASNNKNIQIMLKKLPQVKPVKEILPAIPSKNLNPVILSERNKCLRSWHRKQKQKQDKVFERLSEDKKTFLEYYKEQIRDNPSQTSYIILGDAYLKIFESEKALECYENALLQNPTDIFTMSVYGEALITSHYFARAITFFQESIRKTRDLHLTLQLIELYINLKQYQKAELMLLELQENESSTDDNEITHLKNKIKINRLLSLTQEKTDNLFYAIKNLKDGIEMQKKVIQIQSDNSKYIQEKETNKLVDMVLNLGKMITELNKKKETISCYKEALTFLPNNKKILLALAENYLQLDETEFCRKISLSILESATNDESASVNLIDIAIRQADFEKAASLCTSFLSQQPFSWEVLVRLLDIFRRLGVVEETVEFLKRSKKHCITASQIAKQKYCEALYQWYSGDLNEAIKTFNLVKHDINIGVNSHYNLIEICLSIENFTEDENSSTNSSGIIIETIDILLRELKIKLGVGADRILKFRLLENFYLLATKRKVNAEKALDDLSSLGPQETLLDNVGIVLGIATALTLLKQEKRAKNQLKLMAKSDWTIENAEYLERCWLLLGNFYMQGKKYEMASKLMNKILQYNKSSAKAHEYLGYISEEREDFESAVYHYRTVWTLRKKSNPIVGVKLAQCYMMHQKYPDAMTIAKEVLNICPDCDFIKNEVFDRSLSNLRC